MAEPISFEEALQFIGRVCERANAPEAPRHSVDLIAAGVNMRVDLSSLPSGTLICGSATGEFFKVARDHWTTAGVPDAHYSDEDVATQVRLGWDPLLERSNFDLIHVGE